MARASRRRLRAPLILLLAAVAAGAASTPASALPNDPIARDPTLIRSGEWYYVATTKDDFDDGYLPLRRSHDLVHWAPAGVVFTEPPPWVAETLGTVPERFWAPDLVQVGDRFHLYYSASQTGSRNSGIGLATNATLDPASPDYAWRDEGLVVRTTEADDHNAIDSEYALDAEGRPWLAYGSFWTGIKMRALDPATGKLSATDTTLHSLAARPGVDALEAPSIVSRDGWFYLFLSFDFCCRGLDSTYRIMVGRSRVITGPYEDRDGVPLIAGGGSELLRGYGSFAALGHSDVYRDGPVDWLVHHYYDRDDEGEAKLSVRQLRWGDDGWPSAGAPLSAGPGGAGTPAELIVAHRPAEAPRCWSFMGPPPPGDAPVKVRWRPVGPEAWRLCAV
jgi:beta-xylosidase